MSRSLMLVLPLALLVAACGPDEEAETVASPMPSPVTDTMPEAPGSVAADQMTIRAEVVRVDTTGRQVTLRDVAATGMTQADMKAAERTMAVDAAALASLDALKPGDPVAVTCRTTMTVPLGDTGTMASPHMMSSPGTMASPHTMSSPGMMSSPMPGETGTAGGTAAAMASISTCSSIIGIVPATEGGMGGTGTTGGTGTMASPEAMASPQ